MTETTAMLVTMTVGQLEEVVQRSVERVLSKRSTDSPTPPTALLTRSAIAMALGCSLTTLDHMVLDGLPYVVIGRTKRFELPKVREWVETRKLRDRATREADAAAASRDYSRVSLAGVRRLGSR